nr:MAG TPA: hypothetical protein [Caudoviricetes sp.]
MRYRLPSFIFKVYSLEIYRNQNCCIRNRTLTCIK